MAVSFKGKTFKEINPDGAAMLRPDLNPGLDIETLPATSKKIGVFCCSKNPKHIFSKRICKMTSPRDGHNCGCKYCGPYRSETFPGETDFFTEVPEAKEMWDYSKEENQKYDPTKLFSASNNRVYFTCKRGHSELRKIHDFARSPECQTCKKYYIYQDDLLLKFWNEKRNTADGLDPYTIILTGGDNIHLACPNCHYRWQWRTSLWSERRYCPHCGYDGSEGSVEKNQKMVQELFHIQTLADLNPIATRTWDKEANGDIIPEEIKAKANTLYSFICSAKGHHYRNRPDYMYDKKGNPRESCPRCTEEQKIEKTSAARSAIRILLPSMVKQMISQATEKQSSSKFNVSVASNPYLMKFWDKDRNTIDPHMVSAFDSREAFWRCKICNYGWVQTIENRNTAKKGKCPCHEMQRVTSDEVYPGYFHSFGELNPQIAPLFNDKLNNGITPYNVARLSTQSVYLNCPIDPDHPPFLIVVNAIPSNPPFGCPICMQQASDFYNLVLQVPVSTAMWNPSNKLRIADARTYMSESVKFICEKGHHFSRAIRTFVKDQSCPYCMLDSVAKHPEMMRFWDFYKNSNQNPDILSVRSSEHANWLCPQCGYSWNTEINTRFISRGTCPCCEEKVVFQSGVNDLLSLLPQAALDILPEDNPNLDLLSIPIRNDVFINWDCHVCHYKWTTSSNGRTTKDNTKNYRLRTCPVCAGIRRTVSYYIEHYPEIFDDYNEEENGKPFSTIDDAEIKEQFWWTCKNENCLETYQATIHKKISTRNSFPKGCPYCAGKDVLREKSFAALHPELMDEYDPNNQFDPFKVTEHSTRTVNWICRNNPDHMWPSTFYERALGYKRCPICEPHPKYKIMLYEVFPDLERYYAKENTRSFNTYALQSNEAPLWTCDNGHTYPNSVFRLSQHGSFYCPLCEGIAVVAEINSVAAKRKDIVDQWSCKNDLLPDEVYYNTSSPVLWDCPICSGTYAFPVSDKKEGNMSCPYCTGRRVLQAFNEIPSWLKKEYSTQNELPVSEYPVNSAHAVLWTCPTCHGDYRYRIRDRELDDDSCPFCRGKKVLPGFNSLPDLAPELIGEWSASNPDLPSEYTRTSPHRALWTCPTCHGDYRYRIRDRELDDDSCPFCRGRKVLPGFNSLPDLAPELVKEWSSDNPDLPSEYLRSSRHKALWTCLICHGDYQYRICDRELNDDSCPYCRHEKLLSGFNSLQETDPELASQWSTANSDLPSEYLRSSSHKAIWTCPTCHGDYQYWICDRELNDDSCPFCRDKKVLPGFNSLPDLAPELVKEWSSDNPDLPSEYLRSSRHKALWTCLICHGDYQYRICDRELNDDSCPYCRHEKLLSGFNSLQETDPELASQWSTVNSDSPSEYLRSSRHKALWTCPICHGDYQYRICDRELNDDSCPYCRHEKLLSGFNSLQETDPELASQWSTANSDLPSEYLRSSSHKAIWTCPTCHGDYQYWICDRELNDDSCPFCRDKKVLPGFNSLPDLAPELVKEWSSDNPDLPSEYLRSSRHKALWTCLICHGDYQYRICDRELNDDSCPYCRHEKLLSGFNSLQETDPELASQWSTVNSDSPSEYLRSSRHKALWTCPICHGDYQYRICDRELNDDSCPYCRHEKLLSGFNSLQETDPELASQWSTANSDLPSEYLRSSSHKAIWTCPTCHGDYQYWICDRELNDDSCPFCRDKKVLPGFNSLPDLAPELVKEWSSDNPDLPSEYLRSSRHKALWTCLICHGDYQYRICDRELNDDSCPYCRHEKLLSGFNSLQETDPELASQWSTVNSDSPSEYLRSSRHKALWTCPICHGDYQYRICDRELNDDSCPYCRHEKLLSGFNSLQETDPELASQWSTTNSDLPSEYLRSSSHKAIWTCPTCHGDYQYWICDRELDDDSCPFCRDKKVLPGFNSLADLTPALVKEWSSDNPDLPSEYLRSSRHKALWTCPTCHGDYQYRICDRELDDKSCPYCCDKKILPGYNSFKVRHPEEMEEWDELGNYLLAYPDSILSSYNKIIWWNCPKNHQYSMSPKKKLYYRMRGQEPCPYCKGRRRNLSHFF